MKDKEILTRIERLVKTRLKKINAISMPSKGYTLKNDRVTGLALCDCGLLSITKLTPLLTKLEHLTTLYLSRNQIVDISSLSKLNKLTKLDLRFNNISDLSSLSNLVHLVKLYLSNNFISNISPLRKLNNLNRLELYNNRIEKLPKWIVDFNLEIKWANHVKGLKDYISIGKNPIIAPPQEIAMRGLESIIDWFQANKKELNEVKVILIGDAKVGKTSILKRLYDDSFHPSEKQTDGINIKRFEFEKLNTFSKQKKLHPITSNFWDFGGQEIMSATHRFFLTNRSIYILVVDSRQDENTSNKIRQWITKIKSTGGNSPILIVANQIDVNTGFGFDNEYQLKQEFPQINDFLKVSCSTGENIEELKDRLEEIIPKAELFKTRIDERWINIKDELQEKTEQKHFLNESRFNEICEEYDLFDINQKKDAIQFFNDLGIFLHFDAIKLAEYFVLEPYWITYGVYQILTSSYAQRNNGLVNIENIDFIVNKEKDKNDTFNQSIDKKFYYTSNQLMFLVNILNQFKLCFNFRDNKHFIIPDLLETAEPIEKTNKIRQSEDLIHFVFKYEYLPKSIIPYILVELNNMVSDSSWWRTGCILKYNDSNALLYSYQNMITILITGDTDSKRNLLAILIYHISHVNEKLNVNARKLIPLKDIETYVSYEELIERQKDNEKYYTVYEPFKKKFLISELINGIPNDSELTDIGFKIDDLRNEFKLLRNELNEKLNYLMSQEENSQLNIEMLHEIKNLTNNQTQELYGSISNQIQKFFEIHHEIMSDELTKIYNEIIKSQGSDFTTKLELAVPFINLLGIQLKTEFDIKGWAQRMYEKYELKIFKTMGYL